MMGFLVGGILIGHLITPRSPGWPWAMRLSLRVSSTLTQRFRCEELRGRRFKESYLRVARDSARTMTHVPSRMRHHWDRKDLNRKLLESADLCAGRDCE